MRALLLLVISSGVLASGALAQGVLPLDGRYRVGSLYTDFQSNCAAAGSTPELGSTRGEVTFGIDGRFTFTGASHEVCPNGQASTAPDVGAGRYFVGEDGRLTIDDAGATPGLDTFTLFLRSDAAVAVSARKVCDETAEVLVLVALSSGMSNSSLAGTYRTARLRLSNANPHVTRGEVARAVFSAAGTYTESGTRRDVSPGGAVTSAPYTGNGTFQVAVDGALTANTSGWGAVAPDAEVFFWVVHAGSEVELTVGVREGSAYASRLVQGAWGTCRLDHDFGSAAARPGVIATEYGTATLAPSGGGSLAWDYERIETRQFGVRDCNDVTAPGAWSLAGSGQLSLTPTSDVPLDLAVSSDGTCAVGVSARPGSVGLCVALARCEWPRRFGRPTAGTARLAPSLFSLGGFPHVGNRSFAMLVAGGLGGAPGAVLTSLGDTPGLPLFGGTVWIDPTRLALQFPIALSGPPAVPGVGAAGVFLPLPTTPSAAGLRLVSQAFLIDGGAPAGIAMTPGLDVIVSR